MNVDSKEYMFDFVCEKIIRNLHFYDSIIFICLATYNCYVAFLKLRIIPIKSMHYQIINLFPR